jgi:anti-anti-sigma factor
MDEGVAAVSADGRIMIDCGVVVVAASDDHTTRLRAGGEFDRDNRHLLAAAVQRALDGGQTTVILDFRRVTFIDAAVVSALLHEMQRAAEQGRRLCLINVRGEVDRVLRITGATATLCDSAPSVRWSAWVYPFLEGLRRRTAVRPARS